MLKRMNPDVFDCVYAIMESSFPDDERRSYDKQKQLLKDPRYNIYVLTDDSADDIKAFITFFKFDAFVFVEHFAVDPLYRNQGIGSVVLQELKNALGCRLCLEVELPETDMAKRRIGFYERNGFYLNNYQYEQPAFSEDKSAIPLLVMSTVNPLNDDEFADIKNTLYREVYHINE